MKKEEMVSRRRQWNEESKKVVDTFIIEKGRRLVIFDTLLVHINDDWDVYEYFTKLAIPYDKPVGFIKWNVREKMNHIERQLESQYCRIIKAVVNTCKYEKIEPNRYGVPGVIRWEKILREYNNIKKEVK